MQLSGYQHNKNSKYFRLAQLLLALLGIWVLSQWWWNSNQQGELLFQQQSAELMRSTLVALSHTAAYLIDNDQLESLNQLTTHIAATPYLQDVVVYDANGVKLSASDGTAAAQLLYAPQHEQALLAMVQEITQDNRVIGYIKISMKLDASLLPVTQAWQQLMQQVFWMLLLAGVVAFMLRGTWSKIVHQWQKWRKGKQADAANLL
ncbi:hypothetical protein [Rheinheimera tangshanensis]|jgi:uncharacterized membrane protein affecting hemolysin expression|uniref:Smp protein n=1 Tax=Rheinheimera tangshanensis TaxID=400153 RepID=A0A5C8M4P0_9GAMM|nr:hypothetical protein [Rheinheimera tangshanensis]TXK82918.1 hypothetical protein FU839_01115 [Rheinheimera tangshanensis]GGM47859.1 hypothetical protein GCM10010920_05350 [Rheinheimera tangshanensis]